MEIWNPSQIQYWGGYRYTPNEGFTGVDKVIFLVESGDHKVKYEFVIKVVEDGAVSSGHGYDPYEDPAKCPHGKTWRIVPDGKVTPGEQSGAAPIEEWAQQLLAVDQLQINFDTLVQGALGEASDDIKDTQLLRIEGCIVKLYLWVSESFLR